VWSWNCAASAVCAASRFAAPMDDAGPQHAADSGEIAAAVEQRVHERAAGMTGRRVDDEPGRLVDDDEILVLVQHRERDRLRLGGSGDRFGRLGVDALAGGDALCRACGAAADARAPLVDPAPRLRARDAGERRERLIGAEPREVVAHEERERAVAFHHQIRERTARLR
jgi:hypothetical protein